MIEEHKQHKNDHCHDHAQPHILFAHGKNAAEHIVIHIRIHPCRHGDHHHAHRKRTGRDQRDRRIAFDPAVPTDTEKKNSRHDNDRDRYSQRRHIQGRCDRKGTKSHMGETVADHGVPLQHKADSQEGGTQRNQRSHGKSAHHERIREHLNNHFHHAYLPEMFCRSGSSCSLLSFRRKALSPEDGGYVSHLPRRSRYHVKPSLQQCLTPG